MYVCVCVGGGGGAVYMNRCGVVWCGVVWCGVVWCGVWWSSMIVEECSMGYSRSQSARDCVDD